MINIAVIDDEIEILSIIEKYLSRDSEYSVKTYNNPVNALNSLDKNTDIVLLDIMMPQMNGLDLLPKLIKKYPNTKVVMMTAYSTLDKVLEAHRNGAEHYLMKPFSSLDIIKKKIVEALS